LAKLAASGHGSQSAADAEAQLVLDLQKTVAGLQSELDRSTQRRSAAEKGTFLLDDGTDAAVASRALEDARLALHQAKLDLALDEVDVQLARNILPAARQAYDKALSAPVAAPPAPSSGASLPRPERRYSPVLRSPAGSIAVL
jgi:hypothetical protein